MTAACPGAATSGGLVNSTWTREPDGAVVAGVIRAGGRAGAMAHLDQGGERLGGDRCEPAQVADVQPGAAGGALAADHQTVLVPVDAHHIRGLAGTAPSPRRCPMV